MMYLGMFLFTVLTAAVLGQSNKVEPFMCPVCSADGDNADSECEDKIENMPCPETNPVCSLTVNTPSSRDKFRDRECFSREDYDKLEADCKRFKDCVMGMCETSGCKAEIPASVEPFMCPVCSAEGANADSKCEDNIKNKPCLKTNAVCSLYVSPSTTLRDCLSRRTYDYVNSDCQKKGHCVMAMCETSGCKAELPVSD